MTWDVFLFLFFFFICFGWPIWCCLHRFLSCILFFFSLTLVDLCSQKCLNLLLSRHAFIFSLKNPASPLTKSIFGPCKRSIKHWTLISVPLCESRKLSTVRPFPYPETWFHPVLLCAASWDKIYSLLFWHFNDHVVIVNLAVVNLHLWAGPQLMHHLLMFKWEMSPMLLSSFAI